MRLPDNRQIIVGALGARHFERGYYVYAGSAFAPGGLRARLRRHRDGGPRHWHIDYLRAHTELQQIWWTSDARAREHDWAVALAAWLGDSPLRGFGASDSPLPSHLFFAAQRPDFAVFRRRLLRRHGNHAPLHCTDVVTE